MTNMADIHTISVTHQLIIETPVYVTHMSFGALSKEVKTALAKGSAAVGIAMGSGEGGILKESLVERSISFFR